MAILSKKKNEMTLKEVTKLLDGFKLPTSLYYTPMNLEEEKKKFFKSYDYNPHFVYKKVKNNNKEIIKKLATVTKISDVDPRISSFYIDLIKSKIEADELLNAVGNNSLVSEISKRRYGVPSDKLFINACLALKGKNSSYNIRKKEISDDDKTVLEYKDVCEILTKVLEELGLNDWKVEKSRNISKNGIKVGAKECTIYINKDISRTKFKLKKTIVHEIGTHVLRAVNGENSGFDALSKANLSSYLDVEEGLATYNEMLMGYLTEKWLKNKAALTYAIHIGEKMSFRELYNCLLGILPSKSAFDVTYRVKRGLGDTSKPGIYAKDVVYFRGFRRVLRKLQATPSMYNLLYAGKISFRQCSWVEDGLIPKAKYIPTVNDWNKIFKKVGL
ncbi:DUF1704 domain-containing protein [bacterium]|nr:DUF1704 domain-containing protein [bacterium]